METGKVRQENRGGDRRTEEHAEATQSIINHIKRFPVTESHYNRGRTTRQYLSADLNKRKLWLM